MAHRLLVPPVRRMEGRARLPLIQHPGRAIAEQLTSSMMTRDSLRQAGTSRSGVSTGPMPPVQTFVLSGVGYTNTPESMQSGLRKATSPSLAASTRGQSAGT